MMTTWILLGTCLELLGANLAIDTYGGLPWYVNGYDCSWGCSISHMGGPVEYAPEQCYLPLRLDDPYYSGGYLDLWCQPVAIEGQNGPVNVTTPCLGDPGVVAAVDSPYLIRVYWANRVCPPDGQQEGWCELENVCRPADVINGDCTCTAADEAAELCTP